MNAVIVDIRGRQAAALNEEGQVVRIQNGGYTIGQTIALRQVKPIRRPSALKRFGTGIAAAVLVAMIGTGTAYAMPYGTVTLEGDSSLAYTINCFDYVLDVQAENEEAETLLSEIDMRSLRHHRIENALAATVEQLSQREHVESAGAGFRIETETHSEAHSARLQRELSPVVGLPELSFDVSASEPVEGSQPEQREASTATPFEPQGIRPRPEFGETAPRSEQDVPTPEDNSFPEVSDTEPGFGEFADRQDPVEGNMPRPASPIPPAAPLPFSPDSIPAPGIAESGMVPPEPQG